MKPRPIIMGLAVVLLGAAGIAEAQQDEEQPISSKDLNQMELEDGSDLVARGAQYTHTGNISEIHLNPDLYESEYRAACIKMNPTIPGKTPWACLYAGSMGWLSAMDPLITSQVLPLDSKSAYSSFWRMKAYEDMSRLLHDAFASNKRCKIWYSDVGPRGDLNSIKIISCYNQ